MVVAGHARQWRSDQLRYLLIWTTTASQGLLHQASLPANSLQPERQPTAPGARLLIGLFLFQLVQGEPQQLRQRAGSQTASRGLSRFVAFVLFCSTCLCTGSQASRAGATFALIHGSNCVPFSISNQLAVRQADRQSEGPLEEATKGLRTTPGIARASVAVIVVGTGLNSTRCRPGGNAQGIVDERSTFRSTGELTTGAPRPDLGQLIASCDAGTADPWDGSGAVRNCSQSCWH